MTSRQTLYVMIASLFIFVILFFMMFEFREVADANWTENYRYTSKDPYGAYVMAQLIEQKYGVENVFHASDTTLESIDTSGHLYLFLGSYTSIDSSRLSVFGSFIEKGNEVLFISKHLYAYSSDSIHLSNVCKDIYRDSTLVFNKINNNNSAEFNYYYDDFNAPKKYIFNVLRLDCIDTASSPFNYAPLFVVQDSMCFFYLFKNNDSPFFIHSAPILFTNMASKQAFYLDHFNAVFENFSSDKIILDHYTYNQTQAKIDQSPIQFILSNKALSWAYYSTLSLVLLYIIFRGKRLQRPIPVLEENENTSLDYIRTLSRLHFSQDQNYKLVLHLREIFYQRVKSKYYLDSHNPRYVDLLSGKSKIPKTEIVIILNRFQNAVDHFEFNDLQLSKLHNRLELFYKNWQ